MPERFEVEITDEEVIHRERLSSGGMKEIRVPKETWARLIQATGRFGVATVVRTKHGERIPPS